jgi:salicylate hydroxylase
LDPLTTFNPKNLDFYSLKEKKKICDLNISQFNTEDVKYTTLQRSTLIEFLEGRLTENIIKYGQVIKQVVKQKEMIKLTMEDNSVVLCDYLIICDGIFSSTKSLIANRITKNKYFNSIALRGTINKKNFNSIDSKNISLFMGSNLHLVVYPIDKKSNEFNFITILRKDLTNNELDNYSLFSDSNFLSSILKELSNQIESNILENIKNIKAFPIYISSKIYEQKDEKIFIIGDAFFTFPPSFAQGASQSIEVAYDLYKMFENDRDEFLKKISIRVKKINRRSKFNNFTFHLSNRFMVFIRNILMRYLLKNKRFINIYLGKIYNNDKFN